MHSGIEKGLEKLCECGCGLPAPIAAQTNKAFGHVKGKPLRWRRGHNSRNRKLIPFAEKFARYVFCHGDPDACWPWTGATAGEGWYKGKGYGTVWVDRKQMGAHVATYKAFKGDIPDGLIVRHTCDQCTCCNPRHLILGTHKDNADDKMQRGRHRFGAVLTVDQIVAIRHAKGSRSGDELAAEHGVSRGTIYAIWQRRIWKDV